MQKSVALRAWLPDISRANLVTTVLATVGPTPRMRYPGRCEICKNLVFFLSDTRLSCWGGAYVTHLGLGLGLF